VLAVGRVFLGLHYPADVLAGAALGAVTALLTWVPPFRGRLDRVADTSGRMIDSMIRRAVRS
jgi:membrane-associated phospholipid phosphatase